MSAAFHASKAPRTAQYRCVYAVRRILEVLIPVTSPTTRLSSAAFEGQPPRVPELSMGIRLELEPRPEAGYQARDEVGDLLRDQVDDGVLIDLQLIVSELVTNSLRYGPGEIIEVEITVTEDGSVTGEVEDHGRGEVEMREIADEGGGFGLRIVDALASRWGVCEGSTHVWFELSA